MSESESICGDVSSVARCTSIKWEIEKNYFLGKQVGEFLTSPIINVFNAKWQTKVFPRGMDQECNDCVSIVLRLLNSVKPLKLQIVGRLMDGHGAIFKSITTTASVVYYHDQADGWIVRKFCNYARFYIELIKSETTKLKFLFEFIPDDYTRIPEPLTFVQALDNRQYSDIKFTVEGKKIYAHKIVLASKSKVFAAMFEHKMKENLKGEVEVKDIEYGVLLELFRYIYTGFVNDIEKIAKPLLVAADKYDLIDLKADCSKHLEKYVTVDNVQDCLDLAERHNVHSLKIKAVEFIRINANEMVQTPVLKLIQESHPDVVLEVIRSLSAKKPRLE